MSITHHASRITHHVTNPDASLRGDDKARYVRGMFARISRRYDLMNVLMSFGQDARWRRQVVSLAAPQPGSLALDVGTGTGRIAQGLARKGAQVIAVDFTPGMMAQGRAAGVGLSEPVYFAGADALRLPFPDNTFSCVTTGFMMRNVVDIEAAFREMRRVLQPGGRLVCLEVGRPRWAISRFFHAIYTRKIVPIMGRLVAGDADAYSYLPSSMSKFPTPEGLADLMKASGLRNVRFKQLTLGAVAIHRAVR